MIEYMEVLIMMRSILVDVTSKKGILAYAITHEGVVVESHAEDCKSENQYINLINGYTKAIRELVAILEANIDYDGIIYIVSSNSALVSWMKRGYALDKYVDKFNVLMEIIEHIPNKIEFVHSSDCVSSQFATKTYRDMTKAKELQKVSTIDDFI